MHGSRRPNAFLDRSVFLTADFADGADEDQITHGVRAFQIIQVGSKDDGTLRRTNVPAPSLRCLRSLLLDWSEQEITKATSIESLVFPVSLASDVSQSSEPTSRTDGGRCLAMDLWVPGVDADLPTSISEKI